MFWPKKKMAFILLGIVAYSVSMTLLFTHLKSNVTPDPSTSYKVTTRARPVPLITLFTTFRDFRTKSVTYRNTIRNWGLLSPYVRPVLYYAGDEHYLAEFAREHGWSVYRCPRVSKTNVPVLRSMFLHAETINETTPFYGYANGDILFDSNLVTTLEALKREIDRFRRVLVIGQRINYNIGNNETILNLESVSRLASEGSLFKGFAQDYLISTRSGYPWHFIPDFVVGRIGYDNWLVATAINLGLPVIDVTATVTAVHQSGWDGNHSGRNFLVSGDDMAINLRMAGKFDYKIGTTMCSHFVTTKNGSSVVISERPIEFRNLCLNSKIKVV